MPENEDIHTTGVCGAPQQEINHGINKEKNCGDFEIQYRSSLSLSLLSATYTHTHTHNYKAMIRFDSLSFFLPVGGAPITLKARKKNKHRHNQ
jgi:hypothetical protein